MVDIAHLGPEFGNTTVGYKRQGFGIDARVAYIAIASDDVIANEAYDAAGSLFQSAWMLVSCPKRELRNGKLALEAVQKAAQKTHCSSEFRRLTLAAAYAEVGDFENATCT